MQIVFALKHSDVVSTLLINVKMPPLIFILTFMNGINFMLSWGEHEKVYNLGARYAPLLLAYFSRRDPVLIIDNYVSYLDIVNNLTFV